MPSRQLSTRPQRFAHARLPGPHLTRSHAPFPRRSPPSVFSRAQLEVVWSLPPQGDPRGPAILHLLRSTASRTVTYPLRPSLPRSWRTGPRCHTARVRRCPPRCLPGWPPASPTLPRRARPDAAAPRPLSLEVRLDAVGAVILDGLSYRRAGRMVGISKTEVGDSLDLLLGPLGGLGFCQPDGTFVATLDDLCAVLAEMAAA